MRKPTKDFLKWLHLNESTAKVPHLNISAALNILKEEENKIADLVGKIKYHLSKREVFDLNSYIADGYPIKDYDSLFDLKKSQKTDVTNIRNFILNTNGQIFKNISNLNIRSLTLQGPNQQGDILVIKDCWIDKLHIGENTRSNIKIENCQIGHIQFYPESLNNLHISNSCILSIESPPPHISNPFYGQIFISENNYFPKKENEYKGKIYGHQQYSNLRAHLMALHNIESAAVLHAVELRLERPYLPPVTRFFSFLYGLIAGYGNSIARPLYVLFTTGFASFFMFLPKTHLRFVKEDFILFNTQNDQDCFLPYPQLSEICPMRSVLFTFESVVNPLGAILGAQYFEPTSFTLLVAHTILHIAIIACYFFFFLALRRKFRIIL